MSRGIPRICRGDPRNLANGAAEFGKICRGKLWALLIRYAKVDKSDCMCINCIILANFTDNTLHNCSL